MSLKGITRSLAAEEIERNEDTEAIKLNEIFIDLWSQSCGHKVRLRLVFMESL